jgi:hypothetical protein
MQLDFPQPICHARMQGKACMKAAPYDLSLSFMHTWLHMEHTALAAERRRTHSAEGADAPVAPTSATFCPGSTTKDIPCRTGLRRSVGSAWPHRIQKGGTTEGWSLHGALTAKVHIPELDFPSELRRPELTGKGSPYRVLELLRLNCCLGADVHELEILTGKRHELRTLRQQRA